MATITKATVSTTIIYIFLSDNIIKSLLYTYPLACFLYRATPTQRNNWDIIEKGKVVTWPELSRSITVEQLG